MSFCCMILLKKKKIEWREGGREGGRRVYGGKFGIRGFTNSTFFPASSYLVFLRFCFICTSLRPFFFFFFKMFLYHCNSLAPVLPICICLFGLCGRNLSSSHLSLKKKKKEKKIIIECTEYCILGTWSSYLRFTSCACSRESFLLEDNPVSCFPPLLVKDNAV